jgi:hypothetical protein
MKRFDFAADVSKQLITICAAIITVLITFYDKFFSHRPVVFIGMLITLIIFIVSIACGIFALGGLVNLVERQERPPPTAPAPAAPPFVPLAGSPMVRASSAAGIWSRAHRIRCCCCD